MTRMIAFYNAEADRFAEAYGEMPKREREKMVDGFVNTDATQISWTRALKQELGKSRHFEFEPACLTPSLYRPFTKQWLYFNRRFNEMVYQMPRLFPDSAARNLVICLAGPGCISGFTALMADLPVELCISAMKGGSQCFPLYVYDDGEDEVEDVPSQAGLFAVEPKGPPARKRRDAITEEGVAHFHAGYPGEKISREDVFYYVYGLLHSTDYRERYADNLTKELPRIPRVKLAVDFWRFSKAGRDLAELHLSYETAPIYAGAKIDCGKAPMTDADYRVEKMRYGKLGKNRDLTTIHYNSRITVIGIPVEAYEYVVNGRPAIEWVIERQCIKTDRDSGIVNDANDWAIETMHNPKYPLELLLRVVTVSLETMKIVNALPALELTRP